MLKTLPQSADSLAPVPANVTDYFAAYWATLAQHAPALDLGMGMPASHLFSEANHLQSALIHGLRSRADYQPSAGPQQLRHALAAFETKRTGVIHTAENIMLVAGAIRAYSLVIDFLTNANTHFLEVAPTYPLLAGNLRYAAQRFATPITTIQPADRQDFRLDPAEILPHIQPTSLLTLTNPNNPTGRYLPPSTLHEIVSTCEMLGAYVIVDETCDMPLATPPTFPCDHLSPSLIRLQSFSKNLLLAGYRIGYIVADKEIIHKLAQRYSFSDANAPLVCNEAIIAYLQSPSTPHMNTFIGNCIDSSLATLKKILSVSHVIQPEACYYLFLKIDYPAGSWHLFEHLLTFGLNVVPGVLFGLDPQESWIRLCCARAEDELLDGLQRLALALR